MCIRDRYDAYQLLKKSGAKLPIDNLQFIDPILDYNCSFEKEFYLAGARHYLGCGGDLCKDAVRVTRGDEVFLMRDTSNQYDENAICVVDKQQKLLGYIPRYYAKAFVKFIEEKRIEECHISSVRKDAACDECIGVQVRIKE